MDTKGNPCYAVQADTRLFFASVKELGEHFKIPRKRANNWFNKDEYPPCLEDKGWNIEKIDVAAIRAERKQQQRDAAPLYCIAGTRR